MTRRASHSSPDWRQFHALGLPEGSIRALLALMICGLIWALHLSRVDVPVPAYLRDLLFILLGHYFASRHAAEAAPGPGPPPLFLPRGSVRLALIAGFVATAVALQRRDALLPLGRTPASVTVLMVAGFLLGFIANRVTTWVRGIRPPRIVEDMRAVVAMAAAGALVLLICERSFPALALPDPALRQEVRSWVGMHGVEQLLATVIGYYFGSRS